MSEHVRLLIGLGFASVWCVLVVVLQKRIHSYAPPLTDCTGVQSFAYAMLLAALIVYPVGFLTAWFIDPSFSQAIKSYWFDFLEYMSIVHSSPLCHSMCL